VSHYRDGRNHVFECDDCGDDFGELDGEETSFEDVWAAAKEDGWVCFKVDGEWQHRCRHCRKKVGG
jgi:hypothetical protein